MMQLLKVVMMMKSYKPVFTTRKDFSFLLLIIFLVSLFSYLFIFFIYFQKYYHAIICLLLIYVYLSFIFNNKIILEAYYLRINFGIMSFIIKYKDIKKIYITKTHLISFKTSKYCVGIKTSKFKNKIFDTFISPMDRDDFMYELNKRI